MSDEEKDYGSEYQDSGLNIVVQRMYRFESDRPLKAFADIIVNEALLIKGIKVLQGRNGLFVSMPQEQAKDKKWYDSVRCLTQEIREEITAAVLSVYRGDEEQVHTAQVDPPEPELPDSFDLWLGEKERNKT